MPIPRTQDVVNSYTITEGPSTLQNRYDYNVDQTVAYAGYAPRGVSQLEDSWTIFFYTYTNGQVTLKQTAFGAWSNRANLTYS